MGVHGSLRGGSAICLACTDKLMAAGRVRTVREFVMAYVRENRSASETQRLRSEVAELRSMLEQLTRPETGA